MVANSLFSTLEEALGKIKTNDILSEKEIETPDEKTLFKLKQIATASQNNRRTELTILEGKSEKSGG